MIEVFIREGLNLNNAYCCNKKLADKLITVHKIPLLSQKDNQYYFAKTEALNNILDNMGLFEKLIFKVG